MTSPSAAPPVVVVTGPTAAGKTGAAVELALRFGGEIVNADSVQVYRYLDIGTAKPTLEERARVPHHLLDLVRPDEPYDAGRYGADARGAAAEIHGRGGVVFLTGGTGLYIRGALEGLLADAPADPALRRELEAEAARAASQGDPQRLHRRLAAVDPEAGRAIHPNDLRRVVRALEIVERTGRSPSALRRAHRFADRPYRVLYLVLDPGVAELDRRIDERARAMIDAGLLQECRWLREQGYGPELRPLQSIGYRHVMPVVDGLETLAGALEGMRRDTRRFARRQRTWFRAVPDAAWVHPEERAAIDKRVAEFLAAGAAR